RFFVTKRQQRHGEIDLQLRTVAVDRNALAVFQIEIDNPTLFAIDSDDIRRAAAFMQQWIGRIQYTQRQFVLDKKFGARNGSQAFGNGDIVGDLLAHFFIDEIKVGWVTVDGDVAADVVLG